jgi:selenocysteine lyase/cysteine desulfurase
VELSRHGGIGNVGVEGIAPGGLADALMNDYGIFTAAIDRPGVRGVRVTPNVYTTTAELDALVRAIKQLSV